MPPTVRGRAELRASWRLWDEGHRVGQRVDVLMLALFARMERSYARERAAHVRAVAVAHGRRVGRPKLVGDDQLDYACRLRDDGYSISDIIVAKTRVARTSLYRSLPPRPAAAVTADGTAPPVRVARRSCSRGADDEGFPGGLDDVAVRPGRHTSSELAELFGVARSTVYRAVQRAGGSVETKR